MIDEFIASRALYSLNAETGGINAIRQGYIEILEKLGTE